jgi:hypothetical protein
MFADAVVARLSSKARLDNSEDIKGGLSSDMYPEVLNIVYIWK